VHAFHRDGMDAGIPTAPAKIAPPSVPAR
jgi:hypothetical protein